ncbi:IS3 family transposase [Massilia sp. R2A-15]|uniref:IS3 family transposase n=1 Tax=Massilia sp. R2A-15 TaxID=3064278 RepID=UPI0027329EB2|nr:IS3 family transposase [Massilia sp. R2A-15]WLI91886.1 IS3 family transposase [Massilia sp. R2A-15]
MREHAEMYPVGLMCRLLGVSRSGYHASRCRPMSPRDSADIALIARLHEIDAEHRRAAGVIKMWRVLRAEKNPCGRNRVARLRRCAGIQTLRTQRLQSKPAPQQKEPPAPNLVNRKFKVALPNRVWVGDMTQITTLTGISHLSIFLDLSTHAVMGWAMGTSQTAALAVQTIEAAMERYRPPPGLVCHTDQGSPYGSKKFRDYLESKGAIASMSRKGNCHDNAVAESFFSNLKNELTHHFVYEDHAAAVAAVKDHIEVYYNTIRLHQSLGYKTPAQVQAQHMCC